MKSAGVLAALRVFATQPCSQCWGRSVGDPRGGGTRGLQRGARHLDACAERRQGPAPGELEQRRDAPTLQVQPCSSVAVGGLSTPTTDPWIKHAVVFNYYLICCSVFLKRNLSIGF